MKTTILLDDRAGNVYDIPHSAITWKTKRKGSASSVDFEFVGDIKISEGNVILMTIDEEKVFYGYVFSVERDGEKQNITAYDSIRYLLFSDTKIYTSKTASQIIQDIATEREIAIGTIADTKFVINAMNEDNQTLLDIIYSALNETFSSTGDLFILYDDAGYLTLKHMTDTLVPIQLDGEGGMYKYSYKSDIDSDTFNQIKISKDNKEKGTREATIIKNTDTISKWGMLQYYEKADENMNDAQIEKKATTLLSLKNRPKRSFQIESIGDLRCRAGFSVKIHIPNEGISSFFLIEEATHKIIDEDHTMSLTLNSIFADDKF